MKRYSKPKRRGERGATLVMVLMTVAVMLMLIAGGHVASSAALRTSQNYQSATQALFAAESGVLDAVKTINGPGVLNFQNEVTNSWSTVFGSGDRTLGGTSGYTYSVTPVVTAWDAADAANRGTLRAVAAGPRQTAGAVVARVTRSNIPGTAPGAIYLASDNPTDADFTGNNFEVDGTDQNFSNGAPTGGAVPGIATRNATNTEETIDSLNGSQSDNITGLGFNPGPPIVPSVRTAPAGPSQDHISQIVDALLQRPHSVCATATVNNSTACTYGTPEAPQITYLSNPGGTIVQGNGNITGAGILIIEGGLTVQGTLDFLGLIIVRGPTQIDYDTETQVTGNATLYGSLWTTDLSLDVGGSAIVQYSSEALALANQSGGGGALPAPVTIASFGDCGLIPSGSNGCP
jgi:hypothetical protein